MRWYVAMHRGKNIGTVEIYPMETLVAKRRRRFKNLPPPEIEPTKEEMTKLKNFLIYIHENLHPQFRLYKKGEQFPKE